jgi:hypothetical protein
MRSNELMENALIKYVETGEIAPRTENNKYLKMSFVGTGKLISKKWNVKIYTTGSIVTTDKRILSDIVEEKITPPDTNKKLIQIDDAGIGFPLGGIMIGIFDGRRIWTDIISVQLFQGTAYETKRYRLEYTKKGIHLINKLKIKPETHRIEICSGWINVLLKERLRSFGFDVRITDITGPLQDDLEGLYKRYIAQETGCNLAYDPKEIGKDKIGQTFNQVVSWGKKNAPELLKSGWKNMK